MAILKTTPITTQAFGAWWLKNINLYKTDSLTTSLDVFFVPYNGQYALATIPARLSLEVNSKKAQDATFANAINSLTSELQRQYGLRNGNPTINTFDIMMLNITAKNPELPVSVFCRLAVNGQTKSLVIPDMFALAQTDATFAVIANMVMNEFGRQGKLAGKID
jgi:hypothetical protein